MIVYRLTKSKYANDLSGKGAELAGGRWNSKGVALVYTGESRALCTAELAVHIPLGILPDNYVLVGINIPEDCVISKINKDDLDPDWKLYPHPDSTQNIGDHFVSENRYLVLKVPSAVVPGDYNWLINPAHKDAHNIKIIETVPFEFDERLFGGR